MDIILATRNPSKARQIQGLFENSSFHLITMDEAGIEGEAYEPEVKASLQKNARLKASYVRDRAPNTYVIADDTGIFITAHNGLPGANAAYWAGRNATTEETTSFVVEKMRGVQDRSAIFLTVVVLITPDGSEYVFPGQVAGTLLERPRVPAHPMMPYSSLFVPEGHDLCWAEMTTEEENAISHRGIAFRSALNFLAAHSADIS